MYGVSSTAFVTLCTNIPYLYTVYMYAELFVYIALVLREFISVILFTQRFVLVMTIWRDLMMSEAQPLLSFQMWSCKSSITHLQRYSHLLFFTNSILHVGSFSPLYVDFCQIVQCDHMDLTSSEGDYPR